jgi:hypothetical protein
MIKTSIELYYGKCRTAVSKGLAVAAVTVALVAGPRCAAQETVLHTFVNKSDGYGPGGGLTFNANGDLFGTASFGRESASADGTVFKLTPNASGGLTRMSHSPPYGSQAPRQDRFSTGRVGCRF